MTQYARPSSDITTGWTTTPLWSKVDEVAYDDLDYIRGTGATKTAEVKLSAVTDPVSSSNHTWRTRLKATGSSAAEKVTLSLYQGSTLIATLINAASIARGSFADWSGTLTAAQADAITNYSDLRFRLVTGSNGTSETIDCSWLVLEVPDAVSIYDEDVALSNARSLDNDNSIDIDGGLSLDTSISVADGNVGIFDAIAFDLQRILGTSEVSLSDIQASVLLSIIQTTQPSSESAQTFEDALSLTKALSQISSDNSLLADIISLAKAIGLSEATASAFYPSFLLNLSKLISWSVIDSASPSVSQAKILSQSISSSNVLSSVLSLAKLNSISLDSEKVFVSVLSLGKSLQHSTTGQSIAGVNLPISIHFSVGLSGILSALDGIGLARISNVVLIAGANLTVSEIFSKFSQISSEGTLGIAIIHGSVIIVDSELVRVLVSDSARYSVKAEDNELV